MALPLQAPIAILLVFLSCSVLWSTVEGKELRVVTKLFQPFVFIDDSLTGNERYTGFSIDFFDLVFEEMQRQDSNLTGYQLYDVETVPEMINDTVYGLADFAIAGITINFQREQLVDFSHTYFRSGLQIGTTEAVQSDTINIWGFLKPFSAGVWFSLLIGCVAAGHIMWLMERHRSPEEFPIPYKTGIKEGLWWSFMQIFTSSSKHITSVPARFFSVGWSFLSIIFIAGYTANLASSLTSRNVDVFIQSVSDLSGRTVGAVQGTTSASYVRSLPVVFVPYPSIGEALEGLVAGDQVDAVIYDSPFLLYYYRTVAVPENNGFVVRGNIFQDEDYGIAMPIGSLYKKLVNLAVLDVSQSASIDSIFDKWFAARELATEAKLNRFDFWDFGGIWVALISTGIAAVVIWILNICCCHAEMKQKSFSLQLR